MRRGALLGSRTEGAARGEEAWRGAVSINVNSFFQCCFNRSGRNDNAPARVICSLGRNDGLSARVVFSFHLNGCGSLVLSPPPTSMERL
eukprot:1193155-Prorocentrum_minimum.AAC.2